GLILGALRMIPNFAAPGYEWIGRRRSGIVSAIGSMNSSRRCRRTWAMSSIGIGKTNCCWMRTRWGGRRACINCGPIWRYRTTSRRGGAPYERETPGARGVAGLAAHQGAERQCDFQPLDAWVPIHDCIPGVHVGLGAQACSGGYPVEAGKSRCDLPLASGTGAGRLCPNVPLDAQPGG